MQVDDDVVGRVAYCGECASTCKSDDEERMDTIEADRCVAATLDVAELDRRIGETLDRRAVVAKPALLCEQMSCMNEATCRGRYEDESEERLACDECCGHSQENGRCSRLPSHVDDEEPSEEEVEAYQGAMWGRY